MRPGVRGQKRQSVAETLVELCLQAVVVRTYDIFGLKQLSIAEEGRPHHARDGAPKLVVVQELCDEWRNPDEFHAGHNVRTQLINLLLGDECLIDLPEPW